MYFDKLNKDSFSRGFRVHRPPHLSLSRSAVIAHIDGDRQRPRVITSRWRSQGGRPRRRAKDIKQNLRPNTHTRTGRTSWPSRPVTITGSGKASGPATSAPSRPPRQFHQCAMSMSLCQAREDPRNSADL